MTKIDWTKWSAIAEILSAVAIVATLLYLADQTNELSVQTEQSNAQLQSQTRANLHSMVSAIYDRVISNAGGVADLVTKAQRGEELTNSENVRLNALNADVMRTIEFMFLEDEAYVRRSVIWVTVMFESIPGMVAFYERTPGVREPEFDRFIDEQILPEID